MKPAVILLPAAGFRHVLAIAREAGYACHALSLDYGHATQRTRCRARGESWGRRASVIKLGLGDLAARLTMRPSPSRNPTEVSRSPTCPAQHGHAGAALLGRVLEARTSHRRQCRRLFRLSDCRPEFIAAFEHMANLATRAGRGAKLHIHAPLQTCPSQSSAGMLLA